MKSLRLRRHLKNSWKIEDRMKATHVLYRDFTLAGRWKEHAKQEAKREFKMIGSVKVPFVRKCDFSD